MDEPHTLVRSPRAVTALRREAWGRPTTVASPTETFTSGSSDDDANPTTVGPRVAQVPAVTSVAPHHHTRRRRSTGDAQTVAYMEIQNVAELIQKNLFRAQTWIDALQVMRLVVVNCIPSIFCAWITVVFTRLALCGLLSFRFGRRRCGRLQYLQLPWHQPSLTPLWGSTLF